jgi:hypothetical protein
VFRILDRPIPAELKMRLTTARSQDSDDAYMMVPLVQGDPGGFDITFVRKYIGRLNAGGRRKPL